MCKVVGLLPLMLVMTSACNEVLEGGSRMTPTVVPSSICSIDTSHQDSGSEPAILEGVLLTSAEGTYLADDRCQDVLIRLRLPLERTEQNGVLALAELIAPTGKKGDKQGRVHCVCSGRLEYTAGLPVLNVDRVEKVWTSNP
jgi:hypothetical protein